VIVKDSLNQLVEKDKNAKYGPSFENFKDFNQLRLRKNYTKHYEENLDPKRDNINFYTLTAVYSYKPGSGTVIDLTGVVEDTNAPVNVQVSGFLSWFAIKRPDGLTDDVITGFIEQLSNGVIKYTEQLAQRNEDYQNVINDIPALGPIITHWESVTEEELKRTSDRDNGTNFIKVYVRYPKCVKLCRDLIENPDGKASYKFDNRIIPAIPDLKWCPHEYKKLIKKLLLYEADIDFVIRFFADTQFKPCSWLGLKAGDYTVLPPSDENRHTTCDLELFTDYRKITQLNDAAHNGKMPNLVRTTFDAEMSTGARRFPSPETDPILQISVVLGDSNETSEPKRYIFCLDKVSHVKDTDMVFWYKAERSLLTSYYEFMKTVDPDLWVHHNGNGFDLKYFIARAKALKLKVDFSKLGRFPDRSIYISGSTNKGFTKWSASVPGVLNWDIYRAAQLDPKLTSFGLRDMCLAYLEGVTKGDVNYSLISTYQKTEEGRRILAEYCMRDSICTDKIFKIKNWEANMLGTVQVNVF